MIAWEHLLRAMGSDRSGTPPRWRQVADALDAAADCGTPDGWLVVLRAAIFDGTLWLDETASMPHRLSPEAMLRHLAGQKEKLVQAMTDHVRYRP